MREFPYIDLIAYLPVFCVFCGITAWGLLSEGFFVASRKMGSDCHRRSSRDVAAKVRKHGETEERKTCSYGLVHGIH